MYTLYGSLGAPWTRKIAVILAEKGVTFERPMDGARALPAPADLAPLGKTPVLVLPDGLALFDSAMIVEALEELHPEPPVLPSDVRTKAAARRWQAAADGFADLGISAAFDGAHARSLGDRQERTLRVLAEGLGDGPFFCGPAPCVADIAVACVLAWREARTGQSAWRALYPGLDRLTGVMEARPSFISSSYGG